MSEIGAGLIGTASSDGVVFSFAETNFLLAEAALERVLAINCRYGANVFSHNGVTASFELLGSDTADAANYFS